MIGQVIYEQTDSYMRTYRETVIAESGNVQIVLCMDGDTFNLYRLSAPGRDLHNMAYFTIDDAYNAYQEALQQ